MDDLLCHEEPIIFNTRVHTLNEAQCIIGGVQSRDAYTTQCMHTIHYITCSKPYITLNYIIVTSS